MIKLGIIGAGRIAKVHAKAIGKIEGASLTAVYDQDLEKARQLAAGFGGKAFAEPEALLSSPVEAVIVCVPTFFHKKFTLKAIRAGKHVLCEKPIAASLEEAEEMIARAKQGRVKFMVGHVLRFHPAFTKIQKLLGEGKLGTIHHLRASRVSGGAGGSWERWLLEKPEGLGVFDLAIHDLDFIYWILKKPSVVMATGFANPMGNYLHVDALLKYISGATASVEASFLVPKSHPFQYELRILGDNGCIAFTYRGTTYDDPGATQEILFFTHQGMEPIEIPALDPYEEEIRYFLKCITDNQEVAIGTGEDARAALQVALAARKSAQTGFPVKI